MAKKEGVLFRTLALSDKEISHHFFRLNTRLQEMCKHERYCFFGSLVSEYAKAEITNQVSDEPSSPTDNPYLY